MLDESKIGNKKSSLAKVLEEEQLSVQSLHSFTDDLKKMQQSVSHQLLSNQMSLTNEKP